MKPDRPATADPPHPLGRLLARLARPALEGLTDGELLARFHAGSEAAFELVVARPAGMARAAALRVLGNAEDADDAAQAAFALLAEPAECRQFGPQRLGERGRDVQLLLPPQ